MRGNKWQITPQNYNILSNKQEKKMSVCDTKSKFTRKNWQLLRKHSSIY